MASINSEQPSVERGQAVEQVIEEVLADLLPAVAEGVRLGSTPHWLSQDLLAHILQDQSIAPGVWTALVELGLAQSDPQGHLHYPQTIRLYLRGWCIRNIPQRFREVNRHALAYFRALTQDEPPFSAGSVEVLYHWLIEDEAAGLVYLRDRFEEAYSHYRLGQAERYVLQAIELADELSPTGRSWADYYQARLDRLYRRGDGGVATLAELAEKPSTPPLLRAFAAWSLGEARVEQQRWSEAIVLYRRSLSVLQQTGEPLYAATVQIGLGDAYRDLASRSGGLSAAVRHGRAGTGSLLWTLQRLPFLAYRWLVRYVPLLPNWYFGDDYQDWIIAYLLSEASAWYRRAERSLRRTARPEELPGFVQVQIVLADLEHQLGRWWRARRRFRSLLQMEAVTHSRYRSAQVALGQGELLLAEGRPELAVPLLTDALDELRVFDDARSIGAAAAALAEACMAGGQVSAALDGFETSLNAYRRTGDRQAATRVAWQLDALRLQTDLSMEDSRRIGQLLAAIDEQQYVARFPDALLRRFRRLALYIVLPFNYLLTFPFVVFILSETFVKLIEGETRLWLSGAHVYTPLQVQDVLSLIRFALSPFVLLWLYHLIYSVAGTMSARLLGKQLAPIEREQPSVIVVGAQGITQQATSQKEGVSLAWPEVRVFRSRDYTLQRTPFAFFSRSLLSGANRALEISAVTVGYAYLKRTVQDRLGQQGETVQQDQDFVVFDRRWVAVIAILSFLLDFIRLQPDLWETVDMTVYIYFAPFFGRFLNGLFVLYPLTIFGRLLWRRMSVPASDRPPPLVPTWVLWTGAMLQTLIALLWLGERLGLLRL